MANPTRSAFEAATARFFDALAEEVDRPRQFNPEYPDYEINFNIEMSRARIADLDDQLRVGTFDHEVEQDGEALLLGLNADPATERQKYVAGNLAARARRAQMEYLIHLLTNPATTFASVDTLFSINSPRNVDAAIPAHNGPTLKELFDQYLRSEWAKQKGFSGLGETKRLLGLLQERIGAETAASCITKEQMRDFRDDIARLKKHQGKPLPEAQRYTDVQSDQLLRSTARRYWQHIQGVFRWATSELLLDKNPTLGLEIVGRKGERQKSPDPFAAIEIERFLNTPLYAGYAGPKRRSTPGDCRIRGGHWWSGILFMHTGMRAGELAQLLPEDFIFDAPFPHVKVRELDDAGRPIKTVKNVNAIRDVPLAPVLLELGLAQFVASRAKRERRGRVFGEFRTGANRTSDGLTKFWSPYLKKFGLWKPGRATHVWRHTVIATLRAQGVIDEDIGGIVGHGTGLMTSKYGGHGQPLERTQPTILRLNFGPKVEAALRKL